ncbi:DUF1801 domain-containing protein [Sphingomonas sp. AR_OL41]|uniref:DUF1801 domain-containing protein n=1 Tax=Sphingomonas sp. AR_OL41 TaxID=3042729 RepID=UPI00247FBC4B|nr:DUF1801 domain-containing protein [Sphingomonas sp. AR_OL41]MDH7974893.1 DUF1801 domain-containing protein [Sphingomonas sp. AR_OL41]
MATTNKTQPTAVSVAAFLDRVEPDQRRADAEIVTDLMARVSGEPATMWGPSIIGFGVNRYRYESGREGEICRIGFSPRKAQLVFYLGTSFPYRDAMLAGLGKHSTGKGCLYVKKLADVDMAVLERMVAASWAHKGPNDVA